MTLAPNKSQKLQFQSTGDLATTVAVERSNGVELNPLMNLDGKVFAAGPFVIKALCSPLAEAEMEVVLAFGDRQVS